MSVGILLGTPNQTKLYYFSKKRLTSSGKNRPSALCNGHCTLGGLRLRSRASPPANPAAGGKLRAQPPDGTARNRMHGQCAHLVQSLVQSRCRKVACGLGRQDYRQPSGGNEQPRSPCGQIGIGQGLRMPRCRAGRIGRFERCDEIGEDSTRSDRTGPCIRPRNRRTDDGKESAGRPKATRRNCPRHRDSSPRRSRRRRSGPTDCAGPESARSLPFPYRRRASARPPAPNRTMRRATRRRCPPSSPSGADGR